MYDRKKVRSWMMYDWANSAYATTMLAAVYPIFYKEIAAKGVADNVSTAYVGYTNAAAMLCVAILAPLMGAIADKSGLKMQFLRSFAYVGMVATALTIFVGEGDVLLASILFIFGTIGFSGGNVFYDSLLPDLVPRDQRDTISATGWMFGYIGGGVLLAINLLMIQMWDLFGFPDKTTATYAVFLTVAIWWYIFSLPMFRNIKIPKSTSDLGFRGYTRYGFHRIWNTLITLPKYPELFKYLIAFWFFNDGINTVINMATAYGKEIGIGTNDLIAALLITQFIGIPFTFLFGKIAHQLGSKKSLYISLSAYIVILILGFFMTNKFHFYALAIMVGFVQGGSQSIARSIFSQMIPQHRTAEFFGFLGVSSKFASIVGPLVFAIVSQMSGTGRFGILALVAFFVMGIWLLARVDLEKGKIEASKDV